MKALFILFHDQWRLYRANLGAALLLVLLGLAVSYGWFVSSGEYLGFAVVLILANVLALLTVAMSRRPEAMALSERLLPVRRGTIWGVEFLCGILAAALVAGFAFVALDLLRRLPILGAIAPAALPSLSGVTPTSVGWWLCGFTFVVAILISFPTAGQRAAGLPLLALIAAGIFGGVLQVTAWLVGNHPGATWLVSCWCGSAVAVWTVARYATRYRDRQPGGWRRLMWCTLAALLFGGIGATASFYGFEQLGIREKQRIRQLLHLPETAPGMPVAEVKKLIRQFVQTQNLRRSTTPEQMQKELWPQLAGSWENHAPIPYLNDWNYYRPGLTLKHLMLTAKNKEDIEAIFPVYQNWITDNENWFAECMDFYSRSIFCQREKSILPLAPELIPLLWEKFLTLEPVCRNAQTDLEWFFHTPEPELHYGRLYSRLLGSPYPALPHETYLKWHNMRKDLEQNGTEAASYANAQIARNMVWHDYQYTMMRLYLADYYSTHDGNYPETLDGATLPPVLQPPPGWEWKITPNSATSMHITLQEVGR